MEAGRSRSGTVPPLRDRGGLQLSGLREAHCALAGPPLGFTSGGICQPGAEAVWIDPGKLFDEAKPDRLGHLGRIVVRES
jgi:hypothetical protein